MTRIVIITGSTRPGRRGEIVARWVAEVAAEHPSVASGTATFASIDLADVELPFLDEVVPPVLGQYGNPHTRRWAETIAGFDGFVFVVPEYNRSFPAVLKNAIDYLFAEWNDKAAGFVGYGPSGALRGVEQLRLVLAELKVATVRDQVVLSKHDAAELIFQTGEWTPSPEAVEALELVLSETVAWAEGMRTVRDKRLANAAA